MCFFEHLCNYRHMCSIEFILLYIVTVAAKLLDLLFCVGLGFTCGFQVVRRLVVQITRLNEDKNDLILSEKNSMGWFRFLSCLDKKKPTMRLSNMSHDVLTGDVPSRKNALRRNSCQNLKWSPSQTQR